MKYFIRMDDVTPDMDMEKFERFVRILDENNVTALLGIVPDNRDEKLMLSVPCKDFYIKIKELVGRGYGVSMHGFRHVYTTKSGGLLPLNHQSEFAGLSFDEQNDMIRTGKNILKKEGIDTDFFMAPSHTYDKNTLKALKENGFERITDGFGRYPYVRCGIKFYPISFLKKRALNSNKDGITTLVVHANTLNEKDFSFYEKIIKEKEFVRFDEYVSQKARKVSPLHFAIEYILASGKHYAVNLISIHCKV